jgi:hypothetical protein
MRRPSALHVHHHDGNPFLPHPPRRPNWQGMGDHTHRGPNQQHAHSNDDLFAKVKFIIPPFMVCMMLKLIYIGRSLLITNLVLMLFLNNIVLGRPLVSLRILLLSGGMNCLAFIYNMIHGIG